MLTSHLKEQRCTSEEVIGDGSYWRGDARILYWQGKDDAGNAGEYGDAKHVGESVFKQGAQHESNGAQHESNGGVQWDAIYPYAAGVV